MLVWVCLPHGLRQAILETGKRLMACECTNLLHLAAVLALPADDISCSLLRCGDGPPAGVELLPHAVTDPVPVEAPPQHTGA